VKDWRTVDGWLTEAEGDKLAELAVGKVVLELGAWKGRSTLAIARTARLVVSVDTFKGDADTGEADTAAEYLENVRGADNVFPIRYDFSDGLPILTEAAYGLVFIDGQHDHDSAYRDALTAKRLLKPGGVVAFHDLNYPSVLSAAIRAEVQIVGAVDSLGWGHFA
jgi:predicted O-methyltransferase YrrM